ncbi:MAG: SLC13 family permease [Methylobacteriaceae bacterium]|nr:SLC13 family permease [Methylobacteriaceae bacterium]
MLSLFMWDRLRHDLVACLALLATIATGTVAPEKTFSGFSNPVIILIATTLVLGRAIGNSGILNGVLRAFLKRVQSPSLQIGALCFSVGLLSAFMKNVGALGIFIPLSLEASRRIKQPPSIYLMPLAFASLIGGTATLIGTGPNLLISTVRSDVSGRPFQFFDFTPVGLPLALLALVFLSVGWRLLPRRQNGSKTAGQVFNLDRYTTELVVPDESPSVGMTVAELEALGEGELSVSSLVRVSEDDERHFVPSYRTRLASGDILTVHADPATVKTVTDSTGLELAASKELKAPERASDDLEIVEAVVMPGSQVAGRTAQRLQLRRRFEVSLLAVSRAGRPVHTRLMEHVLQPGDIVALQGWGNTIYDTLSDLGCLPLADRSIALARRRWRFIPLLLLLAAMAIVILRLRSVEQTFFGAAVLCIVLRQISLKEAYESIEWPIIVMLGALIPVGEALNDTGAASLIANLLGHVATQVPGIMSIALVLVTAMLAAPLLHHAAAVLVLGPIAAAVAAKLGYKPEPFLLAVAFGAACDFLTPIGHQNNMLVMGPGGYRFGDYWKLGLPLSLLVVLVGPPLIVFFWPLH